MVGSFTMLVIYGPTATGKTALALDLAKKYNGELISADSRQVYKNLDIGTGKVSFKSKVEKHSGYWIVDGIRINGFDLVKPQVSFSAADFIKFASASALKIAERKKLPIIVGGTGFYIKAFLEGLDTIGIEADKKLRLTMEKLPVVALQQKLQAVNSQKFKSMNESDQKNPRRLIRAIEVSVSQHKKNTSYQLPITRYLLIGLTVPNDFLYKRADDWLETRLSQGLIDEVESLLKQKIDPIWLEKLGLEYRWLTKYLRGEVSRDYALERLAGDIHNFIRRQKSWFKQFKKLELFDISRPKWQSELEKKINL